MLELKDVTKVFRTSQVETTALNRVSFAVEPGEFVAVMGPSGCGKSTLLNVLGLLDNPTAGSYLFLGEEVATRPERLLAGLRKKSIGFIFQSFNLIDELTVYQNIELPLVYQRLSAAERRRQVDSVLDKMGIAPRRDHFPQELSGGQQQRVAVARAVVTKPPLLLADEPTGNLDTVSGEEVMKLLVGLNREGTTIVMVTHSSEHARYGNRIVNMLDGRTLSENVVAMSRNLANV